jgi:hypothetical protein
LVSQALHSQRFQVLQPLSRQREESPKRRRKSADAILLRKALGPIPFSDSQSALKFVFPRAYRCKRRYFIRKRTPSERFSRIDYLLISTAEKGVGRKL